MIWQLTAGAVQLALIALFAATQARDPGVRDSALYLGPMLALAAGTLAGVRWMVILAALFYTVWLLNHLLAWRRPRPAEARAGIATLSVSVLAATWVAVAAG